jgi:hypothetical protein
MKTASQPRILSAERLGDGVIITFNDGKSAIYPGSLLYTILSQAVEVKESDFNSDPQGMTY